MRVTVTTSPGARSFEQPQKLAAVGLRTARLLPVNPVAAFGTKLGGLGVERLPVGADAGIAKTAILKFDLVISFGKRNLLNRLDQAVFPKVLIFATCATGVTGCRYRLGIPNQ
jgi:hypothetical protein